jgi:hypothetical protein
MYGGNTVNFKRDTMTVSWEIKIYFCYELNEDYEVPGVTFACEALG